jgi:hypothetical protein
MAQNNPFSQEKVNKAMEELDVFSSTYPLIFNVIQGLVDENQERKQIDETTNRILDKLRLELTKQRVALNSLIERANPPSAAAARPTPSAAKDIPVRRVEEYPCPCGNPSCKNGKIINILKGVKKELQEVVENQKQPEREEIIIDVLPFD